MAKPLIAIVGRPNVGKSTFFNRIVGRRTAIVEDEPGVTRDRHYADAELANQNVTLCDTGGFVPDEDDRMVAAIRESARVAIDEADIILWMTSVRDDVTGADEEVGHLLRKAKAPVVVLVNKCDSDRLETEALAFFSLGFEYVLPLSAEHGRGIGDVEDLIARLLQERGLWRDPSDEPEEVVDEELEELKQQRGGHVERIRMAIVGRPNVGKSTLINALLGHNRMLATEIAGTTRDAIDVELAYQGTSYTLVDTAGMRRKSRIEDRVEGHSVGRTVRAIERCHVAILVLDASQPLADQDARIASLVERRNRACCLVINKWDTVEKDHRTMKAYELDLQERLPMLAFAPRVFVSALTGQRVEKVMSAALSAYEAFNRIVPTSAINRWLAEAQKIRQPPVHRNKRLKLYFGGQKATRPPRIEIQVNNPDAVSSSYEKFLLNTLRERFDLGGTPLRLTFVGRSARRSDRAADPGEMPPMVGFVDLVANPLGDDEDPETWLDDIEDDWDGDDGDDGDQDWDDDDFEAQDGDDDDDNDHDHGDDDDDGDWGEDDD